MGKGESSLAQGMQESAETQGNSQSESQEADEQILEEA